MCRVWELTESYRACLELSQKIFIISPDLDLKTITLCIYFICCRHFCCDNLPSGYLHLISDITSYIVTKCFTSTYISYASFRY